MISIIMPVHNQIEFTKKAMESLYEFTDPKEFELIIIDNGSAPPFIDLSLRENRSNLHVVRNVKNLGWEGLE